MSGHDHGECERELRLADSRLTRLRAMVEMEAARASEEVAKVASLRTALASAVAERDEARTERSNCTKRSMALERERDTALAHAERLAGLVVRALPSVQFAALLPLADDMNQALSAFRAAYPEGK